MFSQCAGSGTFSWIRILKYLSGSRQKLKKRINNQNFTSLGFNRKENTVKCSFKSDTGSSSLFFIDYNMFKSIGVGPELFKNRKRIRNKSFRTYITRFSVIDLHGRRIHELLVDVQVY